MLFRSVFALYFVSGAAAFAPSAVSAPRLQTSELFATGEDGQSYQHPSERRSFLTKSAGIASVLALAGFNVNPAPSFAADAAAVDYKAVAADIADLVKVDSNKGPTLVRLAWHSSGTYDRMTKTGGSEPGTMQFKEELLHGANAGLADTAVAWLEPLKKKYGDSLSYADLYTLGGGK